MSNLKKNMKNLPKIIPVFPLSNFIIFPKTSVPLNIFEPRYLDMIDDAMKSNKFIGIIQPKDYAVDGDSPELYKIGCMGKITSFNETEDGRYLIVLNGVCRYEIISELETDKLYRECKIDFGKYSNDLEGAKEEINFSDLKLIFSDLKNLFKKQGYIINWKDIEKQNLDQTINTLSMASPFTLEEKQILLETKDLTERKKALEDILNTYTNDNFTSRTIQ